MKAVTIEFQSLHNKWEDRRISFRFDLRIAEDANLHRRLDIEIDSETNKVGAWKLTGPRHRAAELNTFVIQAYSRPVF